MPEDMIRNIDDSVFVLLGVSTRPGAGKTLRYSSDFTKNLFTEPAFTIQNWQRFKNCKIPNYVQATSADRTSGRPGENLMIFGALFTQVSFVVSEVVFSSPFWL